MPGKKIILFIFSIILNHTLYAQTRLWGMTREGGQYSAGVIFSTDGSGDNYTVERSFYRIDGGNPVQVALLPANDGMLYGMASAGGVHKAGVLFQYDPVTSTYVKRFEFDGMNGSTPHGSLIQAGDDKLYGMTCNGGAHDMGVLFQYDPVSSVYIKKLDFDGTGKGSNPRGALVQATDGMLYGTTSSGGAHGKGVLFQYNPITSSYSKKFDFDGTNGISPRTSLVQANDGMLYGMTYEGGANYIGVVFQYDPVTSTCIKKFDFDGTPNGCLPYGSLIQAADGMLYGMAARGGMNDQGVIFQYNPATSVYTKKFDFAGTANGTGPLGSLLQHSDGTLYGLTAAGGAIGNGVLFRFDPGSSAYTKKNDFDFINGNTPDGCLVKATNGLFYGMTYGGGANDMGVIFKYDPAASVCTKVLDFGDAPDGCTPYGSLMQAADGMLYGMTREGGANQSGVIFQYNPLASVYTKKFDFDGAVHGSWPSGDLMQANNGFLYGMTERGGINDRGVLFQYDPVTSGYIKKLDFDETVNGSRPFGSLMQASDSMLYGMTHAGGANDLGVLFQYDPALSICTKKLDFDGTTNGSLPLGSLLQAADGMLYGTTSNTLFQYDPATSLCTEKFEFDSINGTGPAGFLIQATDGMLYGTTHAGGAVDKGIIFQYDPVSAACTKKFDFGNTDGNMPYGSLIQASDGMLYGLVSDGGAEGRGVLFQYDPVTSTYLKKKDYNGTNGAYPHYTHLIEIPMANGIAENDLLNAVHVFPNPTEGKVKVQCTKYDVQSSNAGIIVYNFLGEIVYKSDIVTPILYIDLSFQSNGIYFLKLETSAGQVVSKIVKR